MKEYLAACLQKYRIAIVALLLTIFCIRLLQTLLNFSAEFGGLFRPQPVTSPYSGMFIFAAAALLLSLTASRMRYLDNRLQNRVLLFLIAEYLTIALFHNRVGKRSFICELLDGNLLPDELFNLYALDFLFQAPGYFWGIAWCGATFLLARKSDARHLLPALWIPVLLPLGISDDAFPAIFAVAAGIGGAACCLFSHKNSSRMLHLWWSGSFLLLLFWMNDSSAIYRNSWLVSAILFLPALLPGLFLATSLAKEENQHANAVSWLVTTLSGMTFMVILTNVPLARNLFNLWFSIASLHFATWAIIPVLFTLVLATIAGRLNSRLEKPAFMLISGLLASFYLLDTVVMYKTGLRLTFNTIDWVFGLSRFSSLAATIVSIKGAWPLLLPFAGLPFAFHLAIRTSSAAKSTGRFLPFLLMALATSLSYQFFGVFPSGLFRDPAQLLLTSIPALSPDRHSELSLDQLKNSFSECGLESLTYKGFSEHSRQGEDKKNLILIMLESTTNRYASLFGHNELTWPGLEKYKERMEIFPFFFSCFPESSNADFTVMSGLYPPDFLLLRQRPEIPARLLVDHFKAAGYDCSMLFSGFLGDTGLSAFYKPRGFDRIYDAGNMPGAGREESWLWGVKEHHVVSCINEMLSRQAQNEPKPFFIYYRMLFPHAPFQSIANEPPVFNEEGYQQGNLVGRFKNSMLYQDAQIVRLLAHLDSTGLASSTMVMLVSDHGTMLGENGRLGHGWSLAPELTNVPMLLIRPDHTGLKINLTPGAQVDILPTALAASGLSLSPGTLCQGRNLLADIDPKSTATSASRIFLQSMSQTAIVENGLYYWFANDNASVPQVFSFEQLHGKTVFTPVSKVATATLAAYAGQSRNFQILQKSLLLNLKQQSDR